MTQHKIEDAYDTVCIPGNRVGYNANNTPFTDQALRYSTVQVHIVHTLHQRLKVTPTRLQHSITYVHTYIHTYTHTQCVAAVHTTSTLCSDLRGTKYPLIPTYHLVAQCCECQQCANPSHTIPPTWCDIHCFT